MGVGPYIDRKGPARAVARSTPELTGSGPGRGWWAYLVGIPAASRQA